MEPPEQTLRSHTSLRPLEGVTVVVTRQARQGAPLARALALRGADARSLPTIRIADPEDFGALDAALGRLKTYDWVIFTSANGVERVFDRLGSGGRAADALEGVRVAAIGPTTAKALRARDVEPDVVPPEYVAESLTVALTRSRPVAGLRFLVARAAVARDVLPDALRAAGAVVDIAEAYRTVVEEESREPLRELLRERRLDVAVFTSPSTARNFVALAGEEPTEGVRAVCTGPITASAARDLGLDVAVELASYDVDEIVRRVEATVAARNA